VLEATTIFARRLVRLLLHQAAAREQAVHRGLCESYLIGHERRVLGAGFFDQRRDRQLRLVVLELAEQI